MINFFSKESRQSIRLGWVWNELSDQLVPSGHPATITTKRKSPRCREDNDPVSILLYKVYSVVQKHAGGVKVQVSIFNGSEYRCAPIVYHLIFSHRSLSSGEI